jgi:hypothetical protein
MKSLLDLKKYENKKYFFRIQKSAFKFIGFFPGNENITTWQVALSFISPFVIFTYGIFQLNYIYNHLNDLAKVINALTPIVSQYPAAIKILIITLNRQAVCDVINSAKKFFDRHNDPHSMKIYAKYARFEYLMALFLCIAGHLTVLFFWILPFISNIYFYAKGFENYHTLPLPAE